MSAVIVGTSFLEGPRIRINGDPLRGVGVEYIYEGTVDAIRAAESTLAVGTDYSADYTNPPVATLTIRTQGLANDDTSALLAAQFDFKSNTQQKSIYEHSDFASLSDTAISEVRDKLKKNEAVSFSGTQLNLYKRMLRGQDYFYAVQPVFQTTQIIKNRKEYTFAIGNMMAVYNNAQLIAETNPFAPYPDAIIAHRASFLAKQLGGSVPSGYTLGWLKQSLELRNVAGNRSAATIEYWLDAWPTATSAGNYALSDVVP